MVSDTSKLTPEQAAAVSEISETAQGLRVKMHSKTAALDLLAKHVGVSPDRLQLSGTVSAEGTQRFEIVVVDTPSSGSDDAEQVERLRQRAGAERAAPPADGNDPEDLDDDVGD